MRNLNKLGLIFGVGGMSALIFSLAACGEDPPANTGGSAGTGAGTAGASAGTAGTSAGAGGSSSGSGGGGMAGAGGSKAGAGGGGAGGMSGGGAGGAAGGGAGGKAGAGGGGSGGGGGAPSADCSKWCSGANGLITQCAGKLAAAVDTEAKCIANCTKAPADGAKGLSCWNTHLTNIVNGQSKDTHCPHASGAPGNGQCNETQ